MPQSQNNCSVILTTLFVINIKTGVQLAGSVCVCVCVYWGGSLPCPYLKIAKGDLIL